MPQIKILTAKSDKFSESVGKTDHRWIETGLEDETFYCLQINENIQDFGM